MEKLAFKKKKKRIHSGHQLKIRSVLYFDNRTKFKGKVAHQQKFM
jgi:hypothetical protein